MKPLSAEQLMFLCVSNPNKWHLSTGKRWEEGPHEFTWYPHVRYGMGTLASTHWFIDSGFSNKLIECNDSAELLRQLKPLLQEVTQP